MIEAEWLNASVPLWAFLLALLTHPTVWGKKVAERIGPLIDRIIPN